jgi:5'-3' exonuclease
MATLHLLDATYELFRAYYAMPGERAADGREVGAIRGLIGSTLALLRDAEVTHIGAATDHVIESFRNRLFAGYKTGEGIPEELLSQFPLAEEGLRALGIVVWPMIEFEADDALAAAAKKFAPEVDRVIILSPDKDLAQCVVDHKVSTHDRVRQRSYDENAVQEKFGVPPAAIPDLLALTGDSADGIPGLRGWGNKSAAAVLSHYGRIESIPAEGEQWKVKVRGAGELARILREQRAEALLYKTLATLRTDVPLTESLADLAWLGVPRKRYLGFCRGLGFGDLAARPHRWSE